MKIPTQRHLAGLGNLKLLFATAFFLVLLLAPCRSLSVTWETGIKIGFDSNVNRAISNPQDDFSLLGSVTVSRLPSGDSRLDWIFSATVEGAAYHRFTDLNYGLINLSTGAAYVFNRFVTLTVSPYVEAKAVKDSAQSAITAGGKVMVREAIGERAYLGQYYLFRTSAANTSTYSFTENAAGIFAGTSPLKGLTTEIGYEYAYGDSYLTLGPAGGKDRKKGHGGGKPPGERGNRIVREPVHRHAVGANASYEWTARLVTTIGYTYTSMQGSSGTALSNTGFVGFTYRF